MKEKIFAYLNDNYSTVTRTIDIALHRSIGARTDSMRVSSEDYAKLFFAAERGVRIAA